MPLNVPFVDLRAQYQTIAQEVDLAIQQVLERTDFILGRDVELFEQEFAEYIGARHAVGVASGLDALVLALRAYGIGPGDEVITAANTYMATALAIMAAGATPVLVDIDARTYNMDPQSLAAAVTSRTRAVMPVHLYGQPADMGAILDVTVRHNLLVIEDAAQAHGARYRGQPVGLSGQAAAFSFYPGKNLGAYGDGGLVATNDSTIAQKIRQFRNYGQSVKYQHVVEGTNSRLDTLQAAVLRVKLRRLEQWNELRRGHAAAYGRKLAGLPLVPPHVLEETQPVFHLYVVQVENRESVQAALSRQEVQTGIHYPIPIHLQKAAARLGYREGQFPVTEAAAKRILSLPMFPELTEEQLNFVTDCLRDALAGSQRDGKATSAG